MLNKITSLAIQDFLATKLDASRISIKWMNDVYVDKKKIAGILINNALMGNKMISSTIGIGININQTVFISDAPNPVSLKNLTGIEYNLENSIRELLQHFSLRYNQLVYGDNEIINIDYLESLYRKDIICSYIIRGKAAELIIKGVDKYGRLLLWDEDGRNFSCDQGEIVFIH